MEWIIAIVVCCWLLWNTSNNVKKVVQNENAMSAAKWAIKCWWR